MLNIPQNIRNELSLHAKTPILRHIFALSDEEEADCLLEKVALRQLRGAKHLCNAWIAVAPLLYENEAISRYTNTNPDWKMALPEVLTTSEACIIADLDWHIGSEGSEELKVALERELPLINFLANRPNALLTSSSELELFYDNCDEEKFDPELLAAGITASGYHIERGARSFYDFSIAMISEYGDSVKPYLKSWYFAVKYDPRSSGFSGMDDAKAVEQFNLEMIDC